MKRRGFLGVLLGAIATPVIAKELIKEPPVQALGFSSEISPRTDDLPVTTTSHIQIEVNGVKSWITVEGY